MAVAHEGGIFVTSTLPPSDTASAPLHALNEQVLASFQLGRGASHTEFIHARDGSWLFLETLRPGRRRVHRGRRRSRNRREPLARVGQDGDRRRGRQL